MEKQIRLSVALAVYNEGANLGACLDAVAGFAGEIVIVDGGSTDNTVAIARKYTDRITVTDNPPIFHINKQKALDMCRGTWILQLDADEIVTDGLKNEILQIISTSSSKDQRSKTEDQRPKTDDKRPKTEDPPINGYFIPRKNLFVRRFLMKGGVYPDYVMRLVRRGKAVFPCRDVHEQIRVEGETGYLKEPMLHYSYRTFTDYWKKADAYTTLAASSLRERHVPVNARSWFTYHVIKPLGTFLLRFIRHKGFMDGWYGFLFAWYSGLHHAIAYDKYAQSVR